MSVEGGVSAKNHPKVSDLHTWTNGRASHSLSWGDMEETQIWERRHVFGCVSSEMTLRTPNGQTVARSWSSGAKIKIQKLSKWTWYLKLGCGWGTSLVGQELRLLTSIAGVWAPIPGQGTKFLHDEWCGRKIKHFKNNKYNGMWA